LIHTEGAKEYDIVVDDNPTSPNQKEKTWGILMQLMPMLSSVPMPPTIWMQILRQSPLPSTFIEGLQKLAQQPPQQNPMQKAQLQRLIAQAEKDMSVAAKNMSESQQAPNKNLMDLMKTIVEISKLMSAPPEEQPQPGQQGPPPGMPQLPPGMMQ
jgi:hypothetical protein